MHLRSITMKGFKSFPDRTRLEFAEGVSVIVGPNGSGKSNVTDAVLWALGEQSPLAVRGQTMQDVIFSGGPGLASRSAAEVEVVIDDSDRELGTTFTELSIARRLDRSGDGEYRLNGARCRLVDVLEVLSDTGLGKEMHSVVSQGRVEAVIHSSPHERRLLVEEAAGLGKHRKRRRRAELKLARTEENLSRALDVEREARSHLRPLKRQAEAADLHRRLERQALEARRALAADDARATGERRAGGESEAAANRERRDDVERRLTSIRERREAAEQAFADHGRAREALSGSLFAATTAADRLEMRLERVREIGAGAGAEAERLKARLERDQDADRVEDGAAPDRPTGPELIAGLEAELAALDAGTDAQGDGELARLRSERQARERTRADLEQRVAELRLDAKRAEAEAGRARESRRAAERALDAARTDGSRANADLEAIDQLARRAASAPGGAPALAEALRVDPGYELALAAALGPRLRAGVVTDLGEAQSLLDAESGDEATLVVERGGPEAPRSQAPTPTAEPLLERVHPDPRAARAVERLLADTWVVDTLVEPEEGFRGIAVTRGGRALVAATGEIRQAAAGGDERLVERLSSRDRLAAEAAASVERVERAERRVGQAAETLVAAEAASDRAGVALSAALDQLRSADEAAHATERALADREHNAGKDHGLRRLELIAELRAERRIAERRERERADRIRRRERMVARVEADERLRRSAEAAASALEAALAAVAARRESLHAELEADEAAGARTGAELRSCAHDEAKLQDELRVAGELVTESEVAAQRARDVAAEAERELAQIAEQLGHGREASLAGDPLSPEERAELEARVESLRRRRERIGPVNPLAKTEYEEAVAHVEELEHHRNDLETALAELRGVIRETDRRIRESFERTFAATASNFAEVVEELFPGGRGRLRLVTPESPRPVLGGEASDEQAVDAEDAPLTRAEAAEAREPGIEVEVTPAGKSTRRLSLMSGGERSLVALAFLFAVFLARPCPFYVLDEVEAALDDLNIDRFLRLVRRCAQRAQFVVVTHQKRTMDAADCLYGVSMGADGVSKVVSRRLPREGAGLDASSVDEEAAA